MWSPKIRHFLARGDEWLYRHIVIILLILLCLGIGIGLAGSYDLSLKMMELQAQQNAEISINTINQARTLYSEQVAQRIKDVEGVTLSPEYHSIEGAIPVPSTFSIALSERLSQKSNASFRLFSDYPFPSRKDQAGPIDAFEREALETLRKSPMLPFVHKEELNGHMMYRYAKAVRMEESCVKCHNSLATSPKKDWKVGDVRGVVAIAQPLDNIISMAQQGLKQIYLVLSLLGILAGLGFMLVMGRLRLMNLELERKVNKKTADLKRLVNLDGLTQLSNRYHFDRIFEQEWRRAMRYSMPLTILMCDVDCFKQFNDTYGHIEGDECLKSVARILQKSARRAGEVVARYGGEEFVLLLPHLSAENAEDTALLIQERLHTIQIPHHGSLVCPFVTVSMGIASITPVLGDASETLLQRADEALYQAKTQGRDRYQVWQAPSVSSRV